MRILFIGDIVGSPGREALKQLLPELKEKHRPDVIIVNGENAAGGRGITPKIAKEFYEQGVNLITLGNHTWDNKEIFDFIDGDEQIVRPANFPEGTPGKGMQTIKTSKGDLTVINIQGRTFLPPLDCPFTKVDELLNSQKNKSKFIFVDFHAEATSEKLAMGWYLDGRVSSVVGTHTHVHTADERLLPQGTAYITDVGMTGPMDGILGMDREMVTKKFLTQLPVRFEVDKGKWQLNGVLIELDPATAKGKSIKRIHMEEGEFRMH